MSIWKYVEYSLPESIIRDFKSLIATTNRISKIIEFMWKHDIPYREIGANEIEEMMLKRWDFETKHQIIDLWSQETKLQITQDTLVLLLDSINNNPTYLKTTYKLYIDSWVEDILFLGKYYYLNNQPFIAKKYITEIQQLDISSRNESTKNSMKALYILLMIDASARERFISQIASWNNKTIKWIKRSINKLESDKNHAW